MRKLLQITEDVTWIDHHKTAIEKYDGFDYDIRGLRYDGIAACMLTYCYLNHMTYCGIGIVNPFNISMTDLCRLRSMVRSGRSVCTPRRMIFPVSARSTAAEVMRRLPGLLA